MHKIFGNRPQEKQKEKKRSANITGRTVDFEKKSALVVKMQISIINQ